MIQRERSFFGGINRDKLLALVGEASTCLRHRSMLYERYSRKRNRNVLMNAGAGKLGLTYEAYIVKTLLGYLTGKPPVYTVSESEYADEYQARLDHVRRYNDDGATFADLAKDYLVKSAAYLYVSENEQNELVYVQLDALNTVCIYDFGTPPYPVALVRIWGQDADMRVEIVTAEYKRIYDGKGALVPFTDYIDGKETTVTEKAMHWGNPSQNIPNDVPIIAFEEPDGMAAFEPALDMIDAAQTVVTNVSEALKYNDKAKLMISGYTPQNAMFTDIRDENGDVKRDSNGDALRTVNPAWKREEKELYEASAYFLHDGADIKWLLKDVDFTGSLEYLKYLDGMILMMTSSVDMSKVTVSGNTSGVALGYSLFATDQAASIVYRVFRRGMLRLWELVTHRFNLKHGTAYDFRTVDVSFQPNVPTDTDMLIKRAAEAKASGLLSRETAISVSGIDVDAASELARIDADTVQITTPQQVIDLRTAELMDSMTAMEKLYGIDKAQEVLTAVEGDALAIGTGGEITAENGMEA